MGWGGELDEVEISNLPDKELKVMLIKMLIKLRRRMNEHSENFKKGKENIKKEWIRGEKYSNWSEKYAR